MNWSTEWFHPEARRTFCSLSPLYLGSFSPREPRGREMLQHNFPGPRPQFDENSHSPLAHSSWGLGPPTWFRIWVGCQQHPPPITPPCYCPRGSCCRINTFVFVLIDTISLGAPSNQRVQMPSLSPFERRWVCWALVVVEEHCLKYTCYLRMSSNSSVLPPPKAFSYPPTHTCMHKEYALKKGNVFDCFFFCVFPPNEQTRAVIRLLPVFSDYY